MEQWRDKARDVFPELASLVDAADTPYLLWIELREAFEAAYDKAHPDESLIQRVYQW